jgi:outer membrane protein assembly factor BamB
LTSPLVTNGIVFAGTVEYYNNKSMAVNNYDSASQPQLTGKIFALDKDTGNRLWGFNVGEPLGPGGPSIGNGTLFVSTGRLSDTVGSISAFGLP